MRTFESDNETLDLFPATTKATKKQSKPVVEEPVIPFDLTGDLFGQLLTPADFKRFASAAIPATANDGGRGGLNDDAREVLAALAVYVEKRKGGKGALSDLVDGPVDDLTAALKGSRAYYNVSRPQEALVIQSIILQHCCEFLFD